VRVFRAAVHALARPWVVFWLASTALSRSLIPKPVGTDDVHTGGTNPARLLLIGGGASIGYGVLSHDLALGGHLARQLTAITGRAIDLDLVTDREMTAVSAPAVMAKQPLGRYDAVVITLGLIEALTFRPAAEWAAAIDALVGKTLERGRHDLRVFVVGIPPLPALMSYPVPILLLARQHARRLNELSRDLCAGRDRVTYLPFDVSHSGETDRFRSSATYSIWAETLSQPIAPLLCTRGADGELGAADSGDEAARQASLDALHILDTAPEERFDRITTTARDLLGTSSGAITFIDRDRHWFKSRVGVHQGQMPRFGTLCDVTIRGREHFAIEDAANDPRFAHNPMVAAEPFLRFYAGYPIEAPDGVRVGTLSVFDPEPRTFSDADAALLRGLALMVQNELRLPG